MSAANDRLPVIDGQTHRGFFSWLASRLRIIALYAKEAILPLPDLAASCLGAAVVLLAQFAFLSGVDASHATLKYLILARFAFSFSGGQYIERLTCESYQDGSLFVWALTPPHPLSTLLIRSFSGIACSVVITAPLIVIVAFLYRIHIDIAPSHAALFFVSLVLACLTATGLSLITAYLGTGLKDGEAAIQLKNFLAQLASGALIPLYLFPLWAQHLLSYLPFAQLADTPVAVAYQGGMVRIICQSAWGILLFCTGILLWRRRLRRMDVYGG